MKAIQILVKPQDENRIEVVESALKTLYYGLPHDDLISMAEYIEKDRNIITKFKKLLENKMVKMLLK